MDKEVLCPFCHGTGISDEMGCQECEYPDCIWPDCGNICLVCEGTGEVDKWILEETEWD